jgi:membrane-bound ClpP family serine protease
MGLTTIILLIFIGLILLIAEILFFPGMVLGFISIILMVTGIFFAFRNYGATTGCMVLLSSAAGSAIAVYWAFHSSLWKNLEVRSSMDGKANVIEKGKINNGDNGKTISRLNPFGKALVNNTYVEVQSASGEFIAEDKEITVVKVQQNKIFVKLK